MSEQEKITDRELEEMLNKILTMTKQIKEKPQEFATLCALTGVEILKRLESMGRDVLKNNLKDFFTE